MGGRSSKTKPAPSTSQDTTVQAFDMDAAANDGSVGRASETAAPSACTDSAARSGKHTATTTAAAATSPPPTADKHGSIVHDIWEGKISNNAAPLSAVYGSRSAALDLQVSSSEDEDDEPHGKKRRKRKASVRKKKKSATPLDAAPSPAKAGVLKPVKPPVNQQAAPVKSVTHSPPVQSHETVAKDKSSRSHRSSRSSDREKPPATPAAQDPPATPKADSPSRFFAFAMSRKSVARPPTAASTTERSTRERSSGSTEKAPVTDNTTTATTSLERFVESRDGTYGSSGRATSPHIFESRRGDALDVLERETASALAQDAHVRTSSSRSSSRSFKTSEQRSANTTATTTSRSPVVSIKSQRSSRSAAGRNLSIDDLDEHIMNDILAETVD